MKNKLAVKANAQRYHTVKRASERFGLYLSDSNVTDIVKFIQSNKATFLERQSNRVTVWLMALEGINIVVVYDSQRKELAILYPYSWWLERNSNHVNEREIPNCRTESEESWASNW